MKLNDLQNEMIKDIKTGGGFMDWIKKHKKELGLTTAALASLAGLAGSLAAAHKAGETQRGYRARLRENPIQRFDDYLDEEEIRRLTFDEDEPEQKQSRLPASNLLFEPRPGYRGSGFTDFLKKHKKKLGVSAAALAALAGLAAAHKATKYNPRKMEGPLTVATSEEDVGRMQHESAVGNGKFMDFLKKHKKKIGIATSLAALLGTIGTATALNLKKNSRPEREPSVGMDDYERLLRGPLSNPALEEESKNPFSDEYSGFGKSQTKCKCGLCSKKIMKKLGGREVALLMIKQPKIGMGILDDLAKLAHKGVTKGFNFLGETTMRALIEVAVGLLGPLSRPFVTDLIMRFGLKGLGFIKKYAHKGVAWIKNNVKKLDEPKQGKGMMCPHCKPYFISEFMKGNIRGKDIEKMGGNFGDDLGNLFISLGKRVVAPALRIIPGSLGEALAYGPEHLGELAQLGSPGFVPDDPLGDDEPEKARYLGAQVTAQAQPKPYKSLLKAKPDATAKAFVKGGKSFMEKLIALAPTRLLSTVLHEHMREGMRGRKTETKKEETKKEETKKGGKKSRLDILVKLIPWDLLKEIRGEVLDIPSRSILPKRFLDRENKSFWGDGKYYNGFKPVIGPDGHPLKPPGMPQIKHDVPKPSKRKMLPNPFSPDGLPDEENVAHIQPFPYNPDQPTQDPNMNEPVITIPENKNQDYKSFKVGMKRVGSGNIKSKKKVTKKAIMKKLKFSKNT